jgi:hypothetical protein
VVSSQLAVEFQLNAYRHSATKSCGRAWPVHQQTGGSIEKIATGEFLYPSEVFIVKNLLLIATAVATIAMYSQQQGKRVLSTSSDL